MPKNGIDYSSTGVNYSSLDSLKRLAQKKAKETSKFLKESNSNEVDLSRGESAFVWEEDDSYRAFVVEGLGTKALIADWMRQKTNKTYYDLIGQDLVATIINDLIVVGAKPQAIGAYFGAGNSEVWMDQEKTDDLINGFAKGCEMSHVTWAGGETPGLRGVVTETAMDLAGSATGIIKPKSRLIMGEKLASGDVIILVESSGIHTNGLSIAREIAKDLPEGYLTKLSDNTTYGETLLTPSFIYASLVNDLFEENVEIHYMVHITGHGFRKIMRAQRDFTYEINKLPESMPIFEFIKEQSGNSNQDMYGTFNMGAGFALFVPSSEAEKIIELASKNNLKAWIAGDVKEGPKQVVLSEKDITYAGDSLEVRA